MVNSKHRNGEPREDGRLFWGKSKAHPNGEHWMLPEAFLRRKLKAAERKRFLREQDPEAAREKSRISREKNREKRLLAGAIWRENNREKSRTASKSWAKRHPEQVKKNMREWSAKNRGRYSPQQKLWRKNNNRRAKQTIADWKRKHPERLAAITNRRRSLKAAASIVATQEQQEIICSFYAARKRVSTCLGICFHVDHRIPLKQGGPHTPSNLQLLPARLNLQKGARLVHV